MGLGWLALLLFITAVIYLINGNKKDQPSAKDILDQRYARGEIDEKEYKRMMDNLKK